MKFNVHAGHNPARKIACGAVGLVNESTQNRIVKGYVIACLKEWKHTVYDCTVNNGTSVSDQLRKIVAKCNAHKVDTDVSIHFNSGAKDKKGNGKTTGVEVLVYSFNNEETVEQAKAICKNMAKLGFKNRGVKARPDLFVLRKTNAKALLVECCFVDDKDDVTLYKKVGAEMVGLAIACGLTGKKFTVETEKKEPVKTTTKKEETSNKPVVEYYREPSKNHTSIVDGLKSIGVSYSLSYRKKIAQANGIKNYTGTAEQNTKMVKLLNDGKLKKA